MHFSNISASTFRFQHKSPPLLILISGAPVTGKTTLAKFIKEHICTNINPYEPLEIHKDQILILSTDRVLDLIRANTSKFS